MTVVTYIYEYREKIYILVLEASRGAGAQSVTVKSTGCEFDPHLRKWYIYIFISSFCCRGKARRWITPLNVQCLQNLAESVEQSVLLLGSLCLP